MSKETLFKLTLLMSTLVVVVVVSSSLIVILAANPIHSAYSINPTNPTNDVIKGSISSMSNDPSNSSTAWIITGVYKMENVKTSPTFNNSTILNGTATVTMKGVAVNAVPTKITLLGDSAISILLEPTKIKNHFGNGPIYGNQHLICVEVPSYCK